MVIQDARARRGFGAFGLEEPPGTPSEGGDFWTGITSVLTAAAPVVQAFTARPASTAPKTPPPTGMQYTATGQLVPKQAGVLGGISTTTLLVGAAVLAGGLVLLKGRRRRR